MSLTPKQEAFCQAIVGGENQSEAYRIAYDAENMAPATVNNKAYGLMKQGEIRVRVEELRTPVLEEVRYDLKAAMLEAEEARIVGKTNDEGGVMVQATTLKSKLSGLLVEKTVAPVGPLEAAATSALVAMLQECERRITARQLEHADHVDA